MKRIIAPIAAILVLAAACGPTGTPEPSDRLTITVSILPQRTFVERIGGDRVTVNVMVQPGHSPATYEPKPEQLTTLARSAAYFAIGVPFEVVWLDRIAATNPEMAIIDTAQHIERVPVTGHYRVALGGRPPVEGEGRDPHTWLSPTLVKIQARTIYEALVELDPAHQAAYAANLERFLADIDALIADIESTLAEVSNRKFMVFHPSWGYFGDDFELEMIPIQVGGQDPSAAELSDLIATARTEAIKVIFAQPEFSTRAAETIAQEIGGRVLLIDPLAEDWLDNLREVGKTFAQVLGG